MTSWRWWQLAEPQASLLYTTNQLVEYPVTAFVGITSRTPHSVREDVADRLLLFQVERMETFGAEGKLRERAGRCSEICS